MPILADAAGIDCVRRLMGDKNPSPILRRGLSGRALRFLMTQPPAKPKSNRIYFNGLGRLAPFRDGLPEFLQTLQTMEEADRAAKRAEPAAKRRHGKSR